MVNNKQDNIKRVGSITIFLILMVAYTKMISYFFGTPCFFIYLFKIPCPFCGMTRAHISLLQGNIQQAFKYNPLFFIGIPFIISLLYMDKIKKHKKVFKIWMLIVMILLVIMDIMRINHIFGLSYIY